jgi:hypothetical protein
VAALTVASGVIARIPATAPIRADPIILSSHVKSLRQRPGHVQSFARNRHAPPFVGDR